MDSDIQKSQAFLAAIIDGTDDAVIGKSLTGEILTWNAGAKNIYGYSQEEMIGKNISILIPDERKAERDYFLERIKEGQKIDHYEAVRVRKDGVSIDVVLTVSPIKDLGGNIIGASTIARDITKIKYQQREMEKARERIRAVVDNVVDGIITIDERGEIETFNPSAERLFGYSLAEVVGKNVKALMPEPYQGEHDGYLKNYRNTGKAKIIGIGREVVAQRKDGSTFPIDLAISEMWVEGKRYFTGIVRDISERKRAEEREKSARERIRAVVDNVVDGIITIDERGEIETFNPSAERLFGYSLTEVVGKNVKALMPEPYHAEHDGYLENYRATGKAKIIGIGREVVAQRKDGTTFPIDLAISEMWVEGKRYFTGIVRDISERKRAEVELLQSKEKAEAANVAKSTFLANMSHEIRTPMNAILGYAQILLRDRNLAADHQQAVGTIEKSGNHLLALINDILDISKIEAGHMELQPGDFDLKDVVQGVSTMFKNRCDQKGLQWQVQGIDDNPVSVHGDEGKIRQVLINLLGNAVKFTDSGTVSLKIRLEEDNYYRFEVTDTGKGIPPEAAKKIFEPFRQAEEGIEKGGTGLGLAISTKHVQLMGGKLEVVSEVGKGTTFFFRVHLPPSKEPTTARRKRDRKVLRLAPGFSVKALVADDNVINQDVLSTLLIHIGVEVVRAENGKVALEKVREFPPDIIFMDMRMPVMDGLAAVKAIQKEYGPDRFKIVAFTASVFEHQKAMYLEQGCDAFIWKPFKADEVFECLENLLGVEYEYEGEEQCPEQQVPLPDFSKICLPENLLSELRTAAELYSVTKLEDLLERLGEMEGEASLLAEYLKTLAESYDMEKIQDVLNKVSSETNPVAEGD